MGTRYPYLIWIPWSQDPLSNHSYDVRVYFQGYLSVWDSSGLPAETDTIQVTEPLLSASEDDWYYGWTVTVRDDQGNRMTSLMGYFQVIAPEGMGGAGAEERPPLSARNSPPLSPHQNGGRPPWSKEAPFADGGTASQSFTEPGALQATRYAGEQP